MKFIAEKDSETFNKLQTFLENVRQTKNYLVNVSHALGFDGYAANSATLYTKPTALIGKTAPDGYKRVHGGFWPKKSNKVALDQLTNILTVRDEDISKMLNFWELYT